ncbi:hypothetical protein [Butyrivibrio sp. WCD2001]|uniref:hypothetical protein n=1 Tax=Butyrivibrio sp. WCD2001 TaxID=1280681 RepID=UPI0004297221|nr:hypothetical protein [Butyrivibrio sp. WCD2001]
MVLRQKKVEIVVLLRREKVDGYVDIALDVEKLEGKDGTATYAEIREFIQKEYGVRVTNLYIAQVKDKLGFDKRENYRVGSGENHVPQCPPEKEKVIIDAFKHFNMI